MPPTVTESEFLAAVNHVAGVLSKKSFGPHDEDDVAQLVALWSLQAVHRYDPAKGTLESLLYTHCSNQLSNLRRNETGCRTDSPCRTCYDHALGRGPGHEDGSICPKFAKWWQRRETRGRLSYPLGIEKVVEGESVMKVEPTAEKDAEMRELLVLIDAQLPIDLREPYLKMLAGAAVPKARRERVREAIRDILDDSLDPAEQGE